MNKITTAILMAGIAAMSTGPAFAEIAPSPSVSPTTVPSQTAAPLPSGRTIDLTCIKTALITRDATIGSAVDTFAASIKSALTTRTTALSAAWDIVPKQERRVAIKAAWDSYRSAAKKARTELQTTRKAAWSKHKAETKLCRGAAGVDTTSPSVDNVI